ncbi:MAG: Gfo/Idh/MocA family oxidoreductase [Kiritimatiellae bacterium]|jgi:predicted dehydrogenase|nr:Gfo/Idh/MocA family oxidoreductase [Kiritimatiellia bacterium]
MGKYQISRRGFMGGAASLMAMPTIITSGCVSNKIAKRPLPSEKINVGFIGYGTMAHDNIGNFLNNDNVQVVSVADPNKESGGYGYRSERLGGREPCVRRVNEFYADKKNSAYKGCIGYGDFRTMLDKEDLDAVVISTPDHWHAIHAITAARKGLHIYGQKPMSLCIAEGQAMVKEVAKAGITFQVGSQQRSDNYFRMACEFIRNGRLGKLERIEVGLPGGHGMFSKTGAAASQSPLPKPPDYMDFDMWLGPAKERPFIPAIHNPLVWRNNLDYSGGMITDWGAHHCDIVQWALGKDASGPVLVENFKCDMPPTDAIHNTAGDYSFEYVYAEGTRVFVSNKFPNGIRFVGEGDKEIFVCRGKLEMKPKDLIRQKITDSETKLYVSGQHERNFIDCIYSGKPTITTCEIGHRSITIAHLANIGLRLGRKQVKWDPVKEVFIGDADANQLKSVDMRGDWNLNPKV